MVSGKMVLWFSEIEENDKPIIGEKASHLSTLAKNNLPLSPGFVITSDAYSAFLRQNNIVKKIGKLLETLNSEQPESLMQVSSHIKKRITELPFPEEVHNQLTNAYNTLLQHSPSQPIVLFPSLTASDMLPVTYEHQPHASSEIYNLDDFHKAVKSAWSYFFEPKALSWEKRLRLDHFRFGIAIVVQTQINSEKSGLLFTIDPITHEKRRQVIEAIYGLSELLKEGKVSPDRYLVTKETLDITQKDIIEQEKELIYKNGEKQQRIIAKDNNQEKLTTHQIKQLAELGKRIENVSYFPQEIEWAIRNDTIFIVNHKPITSLPQEEQASSVLSNLPRLVVGISASRLIARGTAKVITEGSDRSHFYPGDIIVTPEIDKFLLPLIKQATAVVSENDSISSPGAHLARERGIPAIVGAKLATKIIKSGELITVDGAHAIVYKGAFSSSHPTETRAHITKLYLLLNEPHTIESVKLAKDGVIFTLSKETYDSLYQLFLQGEKEAVLIELIKHYELLGSVVSSIPLFIKISDESFKNPSFLSCIFEAIKKIRENGTHNLSILLPTIRTPHEFSEIKHLITDSGLTRSQTFQVWLTIGVPSQIIHFEKFIESGLDGVALDLQQLASTMFAVGDDMESSFDEQDTSVLWAVDHIIKTAKTHHLTACISLYTRFIRKSLLEKLLFLHATTFGLLPETIEEVDHTVIDIHKRIIKYRV